MDSLVWENPLKFYTMRYFLCLLLLVVSISAFAQQRNIIDELQKNEIGQGEVTIHQDEKISALLGVIHVKNLSGEGSVLKARGYRVQVYAGNGSRVARDEANEIAEKIKSEFPDIPVYTYFSSPRWLCRVGDYRSVEEADAVMRLLKNTGKFKEVSIVREQINISFE